MLYSDEILAAEDLYSLQESFGTFGQPFEYQMTDAELGWLEFVRGRYTIAEWIDRNLDGSMLVFDCPMEMSEALDADCHGIGKAVCLSDDTALQKLFFWCYSETEPEPFAVGADGTEYF